MTFQRVSRVCLLIFSAWFLFLGLWPVQTLRQQIDFASTELPAGLDTFASGRLALSWPEFVRKGDDVVIETEFLAGEQMSPTQGTGAATAFKAFARFESAGFDLLTPHELQQSFRPGETITFRWRLRPSGVGAATGRIWFGITILPAENQLAQEEMLAAPVITIAQSAWLGLSGAALRWLGVGGLVCLALLASYDFFKILQKPRYTR